MKAHKGIVASRGYVLLLSASSYSSAAALQGAESNFASYLHLRSISYQEISGSNSRRGELYAEISAAAKACMACVVKPMHNSLRAG